MWLVQSSHKYNTVGPSRCTLQYSGSGCPAMFWGDWLSDNGPRVLQSRLKTGNIRGDLTQHQPVFVLERAELWSKVFNSTSMGTSRYGQLVIAFEINISHRGQFRHPPGGKFCVPNKHRNIGPTRTVAIVNVVGQKKEIKKRRDSY